MSKTEEEKNVMEEQKDQQNNEPVSTDKDISAEDLEKVAGGRRMTRQ